jgi:hypothetical protein
MGQRGRPVQGLDVSAEDRAELLLRLSKRKGVGDEQMRYRMILALADGESSTRSRSVCRAARRRCRSGGSAILLRGLPA